MVTYLGSLVQSCCGEGRTLQTSITGMCGECLQCLGHTEFAPTHGVCAFPVYTAQAPGCSAGELSKVGPGLCALPRSKPGSGYVHFPGLSQVQILGHSTKAQTQLALCFVPFPGLTISGDQMLGECTVPDVWYVLSPPRS